MQFTAPTPGSAEILEKALHLINLLNGLKAHPFLKGRPAPWTFISRSFEKRFR